MPLSTSHIEDTFTSREAGIKRLLGNILNLNLQHEINEKHIISIINKFLSTAKDRREGLEYLDVVIDNCSSSIIVENAISWVNHCIIKFDDDVLRELKLRILGEIIEVAHNESDFNKKFVSDYISKLFDNCTTTSYVNPYECKAALKTLTILMRFYPSWFGHHRQKIENFLMIFLDSENADLVQSAALTFHYLQQVGSAGVNSANHKLNFTQNFHKLCRTVHKLYDIFFENEKEIFNIERSNDDDVFEFQDDPSSNAQVLSHVNAKRIRNVLLFIETMIKTKFPVAKETKPKELLEVITRGTSIHKCISGDSIESLETYQFSFLLSEIQCSVLKLLRLFIIWYQTNCLPFSYSISKIVVDCIERSHNCDCFKYDSLYQESSYRALSEWLSISKSSLHPQFQSQILVCILKDITPIKTQVTLTISEALSGKRSQKAKRKAIANRIISSGSQSLSDSSTLYEKNNEINTCKFALTALRHLLELTKLNVKPALLKDLYKSVFDSLTIIQSSKPLHPYSDSKCQAKLYEVLVAIYNQNSLLALPPLQTSLDILTRGANDGNRLVAEICQRGLGHLEILCQPICPSLYLGMEREEEMDETQPIREADETVEMLVEERNKDDVSSVDFDASTDEFPQNDTISQYTDDGLSDQGVNNDEEQLDQLDVDVEDVGGQKEQSEMSGLSRVTDLSEGTTEVFENNELETLKTTLDESEDLPSCPSTSQKEENKEDLVIENLQDQDESKNKDSAKNVDNTITSEDVKKTEKNNENTINNDTVEERPTDQDSQIELTEAISPDIKKNVDEEKKYAIIEPKKEEEQQKIISEKNGMNEADSTNLYVETDEPLAKKARVVLEEDLDIDDVFDETAEKIKEDKKEEDPDSSFIEDDSFVDEVKDYY